MTLDLCAEHWRYIWHTHSMPKADRTTMSIVDVGTRVIIPRSDIDLVYYMECFQGSECWGGHSLLRAKFLMMIRENQSRRPFGIRRRLIVHKIYIAALTNCSRLARPALKILQCGKILETMSFNMLLKHWDKLLPYIETGLMEMIRLLVVRYHVHNVLLYTFSCAAKSSTCPP